MNSKRKGNGGERELARVLRDHGYDAHRNDQMYVGGVDNPDVSLKGVHIEVKRVEALRLYDALEQARRDANGSEILRFMAREYYDSVNQYVLDHAADRGTRIHEATRKLDETGTVDCDADIVPQLRAYAQFRQEHKTEWSMIEKPLHCEAPCYAGTIDRFGDLDGVPAVVDIKCQETLKKPMVAAQLAAYALLVGGTPIRKYCLQLRRDGTYKLLELPDDQGA